MLNFNIPKTLLAGILCIPLLLVGCSNSDNQIDEVNKIGRFLDAPVKGLAYTTDPSGKSGVTNANGEYEYEEGDFVTFFIQGVNIGEVEALPEVPVTSLPKALSIARILQSLDTELGNDELIDISLIEIPDDIEAALETFLASETEGDIAEVLTSDNLLAIETASIEASSDDTIDIADTAVSTADAVNHLSGTLLVPFTNADLAKQTFTLSYIDDEGAPKVRTLYFFDSGTVQIFKHGTSTEDDEKAETDWAIDDSGKLVIGSEETYTLHSITGLSYATTAFKTGEEEIVKAFVFERVQTLSVAGLGGKILKELDEDLDCNIRTLEFSEDDTQGTVKSLCGDTNEYHESEVSLAEVAELDNVIEISGEDGDGPFSILVALVSGNLNEVGSEVALSFTSQEPSASINRFEIVLEPVTAASDGEGDSLASLIAGKTLYAQDNKDGESGAITQEFKTDGSFIVNSVADPDDAPYETSYRIEGDILYLTEPDSTESSRTVIEKATSYIELQEENGDIYKMYFSLNSVPVDVSITLTETITEASGFSESNPSPAGVFCRMGQLGTEEMFETTVTVIPDSNIIRLTFSEEDGETEVDETTYTEDGNILSFSFEDSDSGPSPVSGFSYQDMYSSSMSFNLLTYELSGQYVDNNIITDSAGNSASCTTKGSITTE